MPVLDMDRCGSTYVNGAVSLDVNSVVSSYCFAAFCDHRRHDNQAAALIDFDNHNVVIDISGAKNWRRDEQTYLEDGLALSTASRNTKRNVPTVANVHLTSHFKKTLAEGANL